MALGHLILSCREKSSGILNGTPLPEAFKAALGAASANAESAVPAQFDALRGAELAASVTVDSYAL